MACFLAIGLLLGKKLAPTEQEIIYSNGEVRYQKIQEIIHVLDEKYVDTINGDRLFEETISDMLHKLDPHSNYIPAKDLKAMNESLEGKFSGVGIRFFIIRDTVCVTNVLNYSPAMNAGLKAGDKIVLVDTSHVANVKITNNAIMGLLKGIAGTDVKLKVWRNGSHKNVTITRGSIPLESVSASFMIDNSIGYLKIDHFSVATSEEFRHATSILKKEGLKKLIIDLRSNGGGVLTGATEIADEFLKAGIPIVETKGEHSEDYIYRATSRGNLENVELVILINSNSASASEILAGAIQDNDRGIIVGRRSFGKGLVQEDLLLRDGSNLRLTIARYYTPTGRCIQKPYQDNLEDYYSDQKNRYDSGEMYKVDSTLLVDSLKFTTPAGKTVYGGGGIMPNKFVPMDTLGTSWYFTHLRYSSVFTTFAFDYVNDKRTKWRSVKAFIREFEVTDEILEQFIEFSETEGKVERNEEELKISKELIKQTIKGEIARQLWVEQGYYQVRIQNDVDVKAAIKVLK